MTDRLRIACLLAIALPAAACGDGGRGGDAAFACGADDFCLEYYGPAENVEAIRDATSCEMLGGTELDGCPDEDGASICDLPRNDSTNVGSSQFFYGLDADGIEGHQATCEALGGTHHTS